MKLERRVKKLNFSAKTWIFYIAVLIFLIWIASKIFISPEEMRLLNKLSKDPTNLNLILKVADFYYDNKNYLKAINYYKKAIVLYDNDTKVPCDIYKKLIYSMMQVKLTEVIDYIQKAMGICNDPNLLNDFVESIDFTLKKLDTKIVFFEDKKPSLADKLKEIRKIYLKKGVVLSLYYKLDSKNFLSQLSKENQKDYKIIKKYPDDTYAIFLLGSYAKDAGLYDISKKLLYKALEKLKGRKKGYCYYNLAFLYYHDKEYSKALEYYKDAKHLWNSTKVNYWLAKTYFQLGDNKMALKTINYTLKLDPNYIEAQTFKKKILGE